MPAILLIGLSLIPVVAVCLLKGRYFAGVALVLGVILLPGAFFVALITP